MSKNLLTALVERMLECTELKCKYLDLPHDAGLLQAALIGNAVAYALETIDDVDLVAMVEVYHKLDTFVPPNENEAVMKLIQNYEEANALVE